MNKEYSRTFWIVDFEFGIWNFEFGAFNFSFIVVPIKRFSESRVNFRNISFLFDGFAFSVLEFYYAF